MFSVNLTISLNILILLLKVIILNNLIILKMIKPLDLQKQCHLIINVIGINQI